MPRRETRTRLGCFAGVPSQGSGIKDEVSRRGGLVGVLDDLVVC